MHTRENVHMEFILYDIQRITMRINANEEYATARTGNLVHLWAMVMVYSTPPSEPPYIFFPCGTLTAGVNMNTACSK